MYAFTNTWYAGIIERFTPGDADDDTPDAQAVKCLARANLASACIIAQAIDGLAEAVKNQEQPLELDRRERFAALALQGLLPNPESDQVGLDVIADMACDAADALIERLDKS